jgi:pimeloyl-ACP methyl ester carboxylesterase
LLAARRPAGLRSLALLNPVPVGGLPLPPEIATAFRGAGGKQEAFDGILSAACLELSAADRALMLGEAMAIAPEVIAAVFDAWTAGKPDATIDAITVPTLVLATDDPFLPPAFLTSAVVERIPGATLHHLPGPGHYPQLERPAAVVEQLQAFWGRA